MPSVLSPTHSSFHGLNAPISAAKGMVDILERAKRVMSENALAKAAEKKARTAQQTKSTIREHIEAAQRIYLTEEAMKIATEAYKQEIHEKVHAQLKEELGAEVKEQLKVELHGEVVKDIKARYKKNVLADLKIELADKAMAEVKEELRSDLRAEMEEEVYEHLKEELAMKVDVECREEIEAHLQDRIRRYMGPKIAAQLREELEPIVADKLRQEMLERISNQDSDDVGADDHEDLDGDENRGRKRYRHGSFDSAPPEHESLFFGEEDDIKHRQDLAGAGAAEEAEEYVGGAPFATINPFSYSSHHPAKRSLSPEHDADFLAFSDKRRRTDAYGHGDDEEDAMYDAGAQDLAPFGAYAKYGDYGDEEGQDGEEHGREGYGAFEEGEEGDDEEDEEEEDEEDDDEQEDENENADDGEEDEDVGPVSRGESVHNAIVLDDD
ncbi:hypothetical protein MMC11_006673 [Xylographa trunciseda]|nr:hypothetical protein [Xylographa trunciseda]